MNKIKQTIDDIKLNEQDKRKIFNNIVASKKEKTSIFNFKLVIRFATIVLAIGIFSYTSVYAAAKIFNWSNKFLNFLGISSEEAEVNNLKNSEIGKSLKIDNMNITVNQASIFGEYIYVYITYNFEKLTEETTLESLNENFISLSLKANNEEFYGDHNFIELDKTTKQATAISYIHIEDKIKNGDPIELVFNTDYVEETFEDGSSIGMFTTENIIEWTAEILPNKEYIINDFNKEIYLKNNDDIKIQPSKLTITPIDIKLELNIYTDIEYPEDKQLKFENTVDINFKDGTKIKLNSIYEDGKMVMGSSNWGGTDDNSTKKTMILSYSNIYDSNFYTKYDLNFIKTDDIMNIQIGDTIIKR